MQLSIVIPAYNEERYIGECLQCCLKHAPKNLLEIIVVNNASTDATDRIVSQFPSVRIVSESRKGLTYARQKGLEEAKGDVLVWFDADTRVDANWFPAMQKALEKPEVVCVSGPYDYYDIALWKRICVRLYWMCLATPVSLCTGYMVVGGNFAVKKEALLSIGGFDTSIAFYGEDADIARRLSAAGKVVFTSRCRILTSGRRLSKEGLLKSSVVYILNYLWISMFHRPFTRGYRDIR